MKGQGLSKKELAEIALFSTQGMNSTDQKALQAASQRLARQLSSIKPEVELPMASPTVAAMKGSPPGGGVYLAAAAGLSAAGDAAAVNWTHLSPFLAV